MLPQVVDISTTAERLRLRLDQAVGYPG